MWTNIDILNKINTSHSDSLWYTVEAEMNLEMVYLVNRLSQIILIGW